MDKNSEVWCDKCDDYRMTRVKRWETSKAVIDDCECSVCGEILIKIRREVTLKE